MRTYQIKVIGCKVNQYESQQIAEFLSGQGLREVSGAEQADLAVVHGCAVTSRAMAKSRQALRRMAAKHQGTVLLSGCAARWAQEADPELADTVRLVSEARGIASVLCELRNGPNTVKTRSASISQENTAHGGDNQFMRTMPAMAGEVAGSPIKPLYNDIRPNGGRQVKEKISAREIRFSGHGDSENGVLGPISSFFGHERAFVKVQDGCDAHCSYCLVPQLRPRVSWRAVEQVVDEIVRLVANGYREVVLSGVHLGAYGSDTTVRSGRGSRSGAGLAELVAATAGIAGLKRLRLSSLEPGELSDELLGIMVRNPVVANHLHLPLQSGSDRILRAMRRPYRSADFLRTIERAREHCPEMSISTDVIVGFPGEREEDFQATMSVGREVGFGRIHVFEYSSRPGTAAAKMPEQLPNSVRQERSGQMRALAEQLASRYQQSLTGKELRVLVESKSSSDGLQVGLCEQYFSVRFEADEDLTSRMVLVRLEKVDQIGACGRLLYVEPDSPVGGRQSKIAAEPGEVKRAKASF